MFCHLHDNYLGRTICGIYFYYDGGERFMWRGCGVNGEEITIPKIKGALYREKNDRRRK